MGHYTYWLTADTPVDGALHYIGKRSCKGDPLDDSYMSSSDYVKQALASGIKFYKQILSTWDTAEEAMSHEILLHEIFDVGRNQLFFNKVRQTSTGFDTTGVKFGPRDPLIVEKVAAGNRGKTVAVEVRERISKKLKNRVRLPEEILKQKIAQTGKKRKPFSAEHKARISEAKKKYWAEYREVSNGNTR